MFWAYLFLINSALAVSVGSLPLIGPPSHLNHTSKLASYLYVSQGWKVTYDISQDATESCEGAQRTTSKCKGSSERRTSKLICLDSDNESEDGSEFFAPKKNDNIGFAVEMERGSKLSTGFIQSTCFLGNADIIEVSASGFQPTSFERMLLFYALLTCKLFC
nr:crossover junction endonuclease EME1B-like [Ipomoea batatas]